MSYVEGFVCAVPAAKKDAYLALAVKAAPLFREFGAIRMVENWGDHIPDGKITDFRSAVRATEDEVVVFSWIEYPDKAARDAANGKIMSDHRMKEIGEEMPFDGKRMIFGGFASIVDEGPRGPIGYADGMVIPAPSTGMEDYRAFSAEMAKVLIEHGAIRVVDAWADDVPGGKVTDYRSAVKAEAGETVVYSWIEWPSREVRESGWTNAMQDPRMRPDQPTPFDGRRLIHGGFATILEA